MSKIIVVFSYLVILGLSVTGLLVNIMHLIKVS